MSKYKKIGGEVLLEQSSARAAVSGAMTTTIGHSKFWKKYKHLGQMMKMKKFW